MKKTILTTTAFLLLFIGGVKAQTIQEGINHLYAERYKSAIDVFQKMLAVNPNNIEATYWLGVSYLESDEIMSSRLASARQLYEKGLQASANAPLLLVGLGHVEMLENKINEARQHFETALTMTRTKKGEDPIIQTAIGRAIVDSKTGDYKYAVQLLESASARDPKNTETLLQLGNAYRKAGEGSGGGQAFQTYKKALEVNPNFSVANLRLAQIFASQKNWDPYLQYLNDAVAKDPKFTAAFYELFYYYFYRSKFTEAEDYLKKYIDSKLPETDIQDQYLYAQLCWARKDFQCAVTKSESVVAAMGTNTKPKVYRLLADAYFQKGDYPNAKKYSDEFFTKKNPDDIILFDYQLRADILDKTGGTVDEIFNTYMQGATVDTLAALKVDLLKKGADYFGAQKLRDKEAQLLTKIIELKPKPTINDYFSLAVAYYFSGSYDKSREVSLTIENNYSDQVYGYEWAFNSSRAIDTVKKDSIAVPDALKLNGFSQQDTVKYKKQYISTSTFLADYYINTAKNKDSALVYFQKWHDSDTANAATIQTYIDQIKKMPSTLPAKTPSKVSAGNRPGPSPIAKPKTTTIIKKAVAKH